MNDGRPEQNVPRASVAHGRYRLGRSLGQGGMGSVYEGVDTQSGRGVAVKVLRREVASDEQIVRRFLLEAETLAKIQHKNIVQLIESGQEADGSLYIVQELLSGYDLRSKLEGQRMPIREAFDIALPIMGALVTAHEQGVLHRDIKPENIYITRGQSGETYPKLIDFGLSKTTRPQPENLRLTRSGIPIGTPFYMSPEQARAEENLSGQADVWSIAVVIYEMIAGRCPYQESNLGLLMYKILSEPVPRIEQFAPQVPPDVAALLHRALESDRARRWPSMREFLYATLQCESLAPAVGEVDLATRHHASLPPVKGGADAFAKTMGVGGPDQSGGWNPARTAPFLLTPGGPGMKREIDAAIETMRRRGGADVQQQPSMAVAGRESLASTTPGHAAPGAIVAAKPSLGSTIPGPAALQAANVNVSAGANVTTGRDSEISEPQMSGEVPAAHEEAFSLGPSSLVPGSTMTPPPSELDAGAPSGSKGLPWLPILAITVLVSGAGTFAYMKMRGSHEVAPSPTVAVTTDAATAQSAADASAIADANANAAALTADAGATTPTAQDAAVAQPSTNPAPDTHPATNAGTPTTTTTPRRTTTHTSGSTHHAHSSGSGGSGLNIIDPAALQHAEQQEGH